MGVVGVTLFLLMPLVSDPSPAVAEQLEQLASVADTIMERGLSAGLTELRREGPLGFLVRCASVGALLLNPTGDDLAWARAVSCLLWCLSWWGLTAFVGLRTWGARSVQAWGVLALLLLATPAREAANGDLIGAWTLLVAVGFSLACLRLSRGAEHVWEVGALWGLLALVHPALSVLGIPIFIFAASAYRDPADGVESASGHARLPAVPLSLLASPVIAAIVVVALWKMAGGSHRELGSAVDQLWRASGEGSAALPMGITAGSAMFAGFLNLGWATTFLAAMGAWLAGPAPHVRISVFIVASTLIAGGLNGRVDDPAANLMLVMVPCAVALGFGALRRLGMTRSS